MVKLATGAGSMIMVWVTVLVHGPSVMVRVTVYVPGVTYTCDGDSSVTDQPSPKSHTLPVWAVLVFTKFTTVFTQAVEGEVNEAAIFPTCIYPGMTSVFVQPLASVTVSVTV